VRRRQHRTDHNQADIIKALRACGCVVHDIGRPVDLLVGFRGGTYLVEVKNKAGRNRLTPAQHAFIAAWCGGPLLVVTDAADAVEAITVKAR